MKELRHKHIVTLYEVLDNDEQSDKVCALCVPTPHTHITHHEDGGSMSFDTNPMIRCTW